MEKLYSKKGVIENYLLLDICSFSGHFVIFDLCVFQFNIGEISSDCGLLTLSCWGYFQYLRIFALPCSRFLPYSFPALVIAYYVQSGIVFLSCDICK